MPNLFINQKHITDDQRQALNTRLQELFSPEEIADLHSLDEVSVQKRFAHKLRTLNMRHLTEGKTAFVQNFHGDYVNYISDEHKAENWKEYVNQQGRDGVAWGNYVDAKSLAELLGVHLCVNIINTFDGSQTSIFLHRCENDDTPTFVINNTNSIHWHANGKTEGDNNCLYNAFLKELQKMSKPQPSLASKLNNQEYALSNNINELFNVENKAQIVALQKELEQAFNCALKPSELDAQLKDERDRISRLPESVQIQIAEDYICAVALVRTDPNYVNCLRFVASAQETPATPQIPAIAASG